MPATTPTPIVVTTEAQLNSAIATVNAGAAGAYTISIAGPITFTTPLTAIDVPGGSTLVIEGNGHAVDGGGTQRGLVVGSGQVTIQDLTIQDMLAQGGGAGGDGGGGGGLGGGLLVGAAASVTAVNVAFSHDSARGGAGGSAGATTAAATGSDAGNTGGSGTNGGLLASLVGAGAAGSGGGGGSGGNAAASGTSGTAGTGGGTSAAGLVSTNAVGAGGGGGGGGGGLGGAGGSGGGNGSASTLLPLGLSVLGNSTVAGGAGGTGGTGSLGGGGGGGGAGAPGLGLVAAGVGQQGNVANTDGGTGGAGGAGGFGGGGGGGGGSSAGGAGGAGGTGGFGAGAGAAGTGSGANGAGGGGLGAGGDIFVASGGTLDIQSGSLSGASVAGGAAGGSGAAAGAADGSGIFVQGNASLAFNPAVGTTLSLGDVIADQSGSGGTGSNAGTASVVVSGAGTVSLSAIDTYSGGTRLNGGTLLVAANGVAGRGAITFAAGTASTLEGGGTIANAVVLNGGTDTVESSSPTGTLTLSGPITGAGTLTAGGGTVVLGGANSFSGGAMIGSGTLDLASAASAGTGTLGFGAGLATLELSHGTTLASVVTGFGTADTIDLAALSYTPALTAHVQGGELTISSGGTTVAQVAVTLADGTLVQLAHDAGTGTDVRLVAPLVLSAGATTIASSDAASTRPFASVALADPNGVSAETATVTLRDAQGNPSDADGTLSGAGLTHTGPGTYTLAGSSAAGLVSALQALSFTPTAHQVAPGASVATSFGVSVADSYGATGSLATPIVLSATATPAQPVFTTGGQPATGATTSTIATDDATAVNPFTGDAVADPTLGVTDTVTVVLTDANGHAGDANGTLSGAGVAEAVPGSGTYTVTGSPSTLTGELAALRFTPTAHQATPGSSTATTLSLSLSSPGTTPVAVGTVVINATALNDLASISGTAPVSDTTGAPVSPFAGVVIADPDAGASESVTLTLLDASGHPTDANGTLTGTGITETSPGVYVLTGSPSAVSAALNAAVFTPTADQVAPGASVATTFAIAVSNNGGPAVTDSSTVLTATAPDTGPSFSGSFSPVATTDEASTTPLAGVGVVDPDKGAVDTLTIVLQGGHGDANGTLSGGGIVETASGSGTYTLSGTPTSLDLALQAVTFTPTAHQVAPGSSVSTTLALSLTDGMSAPVTATQVINATSTHDSLTVTNGGPAAVAASSGGTITPFAAVSVMQPDAGVSATATITVSATGTSSGATFAPSGLTASSPGTYVLGAATPAQLATELDQLAFTSSGTGTFALGLVVNDTLGDSVTTPVTTIKVYPAGQLPSISGVAASTATSDEHAASPFAGVTVADGSAGAMDTVTITLSGAGGPGAANGTLSGSGIVATSTPGIYTVTGTPGAVTATLRGAVFTPTAHEVSSGSTVTTTLSLAVSNAGYGPVTASTSVNATAAYDVPVLGGVATGVPGSDSAVVSPLAHATIADPDVGAVETVTLTLTSGGTTGDATGTLSGNGLHETASGSGTYTLSGSPAVVTSALQGVVFTPTAHQVAPGSSVATTLSVAVAKPGVAAPATGSTVMTISAVAAQPTLAGGQPGAEGRYLVATDDATAVHPFGTETVQDPTHGASDSVTLTLLGAGGTATDANGTLSGGGVVETSPGVYILSAATPSTVSAALDAVVFTPTRHQVAPGVSVATTITTVLSNGSVTAHAPDTVVAVSALNDPASIAGTAPVSDPDGAPKNPFATISVTDPDLGASETVTVQLLDASGNPNDLGGTLAGPGLHETAAGSGIYVVTGSPSDVTAALRAAVFTTNPDAAAPGTSVATTLSVAVSNDGAPAVTDSGTVFDATVPYRPVLTGGQPGADGRYAVATNDETLVNPFATETVQDATPGASDSVTLTLLNAGGVAGDLNGMLSGGGVVETLQGSGVYVIAAGTPSQIGTALAGVVFTPTAHQTTPGAAVVTTIRTVLANAGTSAQAPDTVVTATAVNDPATVTGLVAQQGGNGIAPVSPFAGVAVSDPDRGASESVTVTLLGAGGAATDANGVLTGLTETLPGSGVYTVAGSPGQVTAALQAARFVPVQAGATSITTTLSLSIASDGGPAQSYTPTVYTETPSGTGTGTPPQGVPPAPVLTGVGPSATTDGVATNPFASLAVTDARPTETATVTFSSALGRLSSLAGGTLGTDPNGNTTYTVGGTDAAVQAALRGLVFTPTPNEAQPGAPVTVPFTLAIGNDLATTTASSAAVTVTRAPNETFTWVGPNGGDFGASGNWLQNGVQLGTVPNATDTALFQGNGSAPLTINGNGAVGQLAVIGEDVSLTGTITATGETSPGSATLTGFEVLGGALTIASTAALSTGAAFAADRSSVTLNGRLTDSSATISATSSMLMTGATSFWVTPGTESIAGTLTSTDHTSNAFGTLAVSGETDLDPTANRIGTGTIELDSGALYAIAQPGTTGGQVLLEGKFVLPDGTTNTLGTKNGAVLLSRPLVTGQGLTVISGGHVILQGQIPATLGGLVADGATVDFETTGTGAISTAADSNNTLILGLADTNVLSQGTDTIQLGSGDLTVSVTGRANITGGTGDDTIDATSADTVTVTGGAGAILITGTSNAIINEANGGSVNYQGTGTVAFVGVASGGSETVTAGGSGTINTGSGANTVTLTAGSHVVNSTGNDTITSGGDGADTINASGSTALVNNTGGPLTFTGGAGSYTVMGGAGSVTVSGGGAGGYYQGGTGGANVLAAGGANTTLVGGGAGDQLIGSATGANQLLGGSGPETLRGGGGLSLIASGTGSSLITTGAGISEVYGGTGGHDTIMSGSGQTFVVSQNNESVVGGSGQSIVYGGANGGDTIHGGSAGDVMVAGGGSEQMLAGTGNDTMYAGTGSSLMVGSDKGATLMVGGQVAIDFVGGAGQTTVFGSQGNDVVTAGSGAMLAVQGGGNNLFQFGSGDSSVFSGSGTNTFAFTSGSGGGTDVIIGFKVGQDQVTLSGFGGQAVAGRQVTGGSTVVTLTDGTNVVFSGVTTLAAGTFG